jgi:hypothetical protein
LHSVDEKELIAGAGKALPQAKRAPAAGKVLGGEDLAALFGLDMAQGAGPDIAKPKRAKAPAGKKVAAEPERKGKARATGSAGRRRKEPT